MLPGALAVPIVIGSIFVMPALIQPLRVVYPATKKPEQLHQRKVPVKKENKFVTNRAIFYQTSMNHEVQLLSKQRLNHDVLQFHLQRPDGYQFEAGQAIELFLTEPEKKGPAPFTFTGLNTSSFLELTIKIYEEHKGLTAALSKLKVGDKVMITDPWDAFTNNGPGTFIAGGAGITPFIALLRQMRVDGSIGNSRLFFSNKTEQDIFLHEELRQILGDCYVDVITRKPSEPIAQHIDETFLRKHITNLKQPFYVCGPPAFTESIQLALKTIGATEQMVKVSL
jgi:ferredoxin-NADP reductase